MSYGVLSEYLNKRDKKLDVIQKSLSYVLFACVTLIVLQGFCCLMCLGRVKNTLADHSHFMYYSQIYLKICTIFTACVLAIYYAFGIYRAIERGKPFVGKAVSDNLILIPFAIMLLWSFFATLKSPDVEMSLYGSGYINEGFFTVLQYAVVFLSAYAIRNHVKFAKSAIVWIFIALAGLITVSLLCVELFKGFLERVTGLTFYTAVSRGVFNNSNHFGYFLAMSSTATFAAVVFSKKKILVAVAAVLLSLNVYFLFVCDTLGANLAYVGGVIFIVCSGIITKKFDWKKFLIAASVSALLTLTIELVGRTEMWRSYVKLFEDIKKVLTGGGESGGDVSSAGTNRFGLWMRTIEVIKMTPWFGKGLDLYYNNNIYDRTLDVAHNEYLTMASNIGIPGLIMYIIALVWWFTRAVISRKRLSSSDLMLLTGAFAYLISAFFGNSFTYTYPYFLVFFALSIQPVEWNKERYDILQIKNENSLDIIPKTTDPTV